MAARAGVFRPPTKPTYPGFAASDGARADGAGLLVSTQDLGHTTVRHSQLSRDYARSNAVVGHLHDLVSDVIRQRPPVDEHAAELVDPPLAQRGGHCGATQHTNSHNSTINGYIRV